MSLPADAKLFPAISEHNSVTYFTDSLHFDMSDQACFNGGTGF
jgi:hypothetical protein